MNERGAATSRRQPLMPAGDDRAATPPPADRNRDGTSKPFVVPPSPPPGRPSSLCLALTRLADVQSQMEFAYAKQMQLSKVHEVMKARIEVLEKLPVGLDAYKKELEELMAQEDDGGGKMSAKG